MTFQPELQRQKEEREGTFQVLHTPRDENVISKAIIEDFQEAKQQALSTSKSGPAWKLRQMLFGKNPDHPENEQAAAKESVNHQAGGDNRNSQT